MTHVPKLAAKCDNIYNAKAGLYCLGLLNIGEMANQLLESRVPENVIHDVGDAIPLKNGWFLSTLPQSVW